MDGPSPPAAISARPLMPREGKKRKVGSGPQQPTLKRNSACLNCRTRKLKCDGVHPVCTTCKKSLRYATEHLKAGVPPPPCQWEEDKTARKGEEKGAKAKRPRKSAALPADDGLGSSAGTSAATCDSGPLVDPPSVSKSAAGSPDIDPRLHFYPSPSPFSPSPAHPAAPPPSTHLHHTHHSLEDAHTLASLPLLFGRQLPSLPPPNAAYTPVPFPFPSSSYSHVDTFPPSAPTPAHEPQRSIAPALGGCSSTPFSTPPPLPNLSAPSPPPGFLSDVLNHSTQTDWAQQYAPPPATQPPSPNLSVAPGPAFASQRVDLSANTVFSGLMEFKHSNGLTGATGLGIPLANLSSPAASLKASGSGGGKGKSRQAPVEDEGATLAFGQSRPIRIPFSEADMTAIFWPGWPPHLPAPAQMHRSVECFFSCTHMAHNIFNKTKLLKLLALPPTHHQFPHPSILHAICAASSRFLGDVYTEPPEEAAFARPQVRRTHRNVLSDPGSTRPTWNGIGTPPSTARKGVDADFGEVHSTWACLYIEDALDDAGLWQSIVQASTILAHYYVQSAKWSQGCLMNARAIRMITPLGLHLKDVPPEVSKLFPGPDDGIEISERRNLFWSLLAIDTLSSAASGWAGCLDDRVVTCPIPARHASDAVQQPEEMSDDEQSIHTDQIFTSHSPAVTTSTLMFKAILLVRRVHEFLRVAKALDFADPRESADFCRLDGLLSSFRQSLPVEHRNAVKPLFSAGTHEAIDLDGLMIHICSLAAVIQLHEKFAKVGKESDYSLLRMLAASRGLIGIVHQLFATSFDLSRLPPFASFSWFLAARCITHVLRRAVRNGDRAVEGSCRSEIALLQAAMQEVGRRLPIGVREAVMCSTILNSISCSDRAQQQALFNREGAKRGAAATPHSTPSSGGGMSLATVDRQMEFRNVTEAFAGKLVTELDQSALETPSRWAEMLAAEVEEERRTLSTTLEAAFSWPPDDFVQVRSEVAPSWAF